MSAFSSRLETPTVREDATIQSTKLLLPSRFLWAVSEPRHTRSSRSRPAIIHFLPLPFGNPLTPSNTVCTPPLHSNPVQSLPLPATPSLPSSSCPPRAVHSPNSSYLTSRQ